MRNLRLMEVRECPRRSLSGQHCMRSQASGRSGARTAVRAPLRVSFWLLQLALDEVSESFPARSSWPPPVWVPVTAKDLSIWTMTSSPALVVMCAS